MGTTLVLRGSKAVQCLVSSGSSIVRLYSAMESFTAIQGQTLRAYYGAGLHSHVLGTK